MAPDAPAPGRPGPLPTDLAEIDVVVDLTDRLLAPDASSDRTGCLDGRSATIAAEGALRPVPSRSLLVVEVPGARADWFLGALTGDGRIQRPGRPSLLASAAEASRAAIAVPCTLRRWCDLGRARVGELLEEMAPGRLLLLGRRDLRAAAAVEHRDEVATARRLPSPCTLGPDDLDLARVAELHGRLHDVVDEVHREADARGLPTLVVRFEEWARQPAAGLGHVRRWLGTDASALRGVGAPVPCHDCDAVEAQVVARAALEDPCDRCDEAA